METSFFLLRQRLATMRTAIDSRSLVQSRAERRLNGAARPFAKGASEILRARSANEAQAHPARLGAARI